jgi:hypothetical protein
VDRVTNNQPSDRLARGEVLSLAPREVSESRRYRQPHPRQNGKMRLCPFFHGE